MRVGLKIFVIGVLLLLIILVRMYEYKFFYDPFMYFFERSYQDGSQLNIPPEFYFNLFLRYFTNMMLSLSILYLTFGKRSVLIFSLWVYAIFLIVLFPSFIFLMNRVSPDHYIMAFYVRRFLAHPVLLLILLPAFYYNRLLQRRKR